MSDDFLLKIIGNYVNKVNSSLRDRVSLWNCSIADREIRDVVGGIMARQVSLATNLASNHGIWNYHIAPIILRCMADVYITYCWILKDVKTRSRQFIEYGLGQEKLALEKYKEQIQKENVNIPDDIHEFIKIREKMLDCERHNFLIPVNLGSWSEMSTRAMAQEVGEEKYYDYVFVQFSSAVHSTWQHIWRVNLLPCTNPLHGFHRVPANPVSSPDLHYLMTGASYLCELFRKFDYEMLKIDDMKYSWSTYDFLNDNFVKHSKKKKTGKKQKKRQVSHRRTRKT